MSSINIATAIMEMARLQPDATAISIPERRWWFPIGSPAYRNVTFGELANQVKKISLGICDAGFAKGDRVLMMVPPGLNFFVLSFSMLQVGIVPVFIDPGIGLRNMKICITEASPNGFIGISRAHIARILLGWGKKSIHKTITIGSRLFWRGNSLKRICKKDTAGDQPHFFHPDSDDMAAVIFTSGSTGLPKGVVYTHGNFHAQLQMIRDVFGFAPGDIDMPTFPPYALFNAALGVTSILPDMDPRKPARVNPLRIIEPVRRFRVQSMFGSPALLDVVGRYAEKNGVRLSSLKRVISSGAPVSPKIVMRFSSMLSPDAQIFTPYGATEAMPVTNIGSKELLSGAYNKTESGAGICIGRPLKGVEVAIIQIKDDRIPLWSEVLELPKGTIGEIVVKGKNVTREYFERPSATALAKIQDGEFVRHRMGDLGYFDAENVLWFCGRKAHRVIQGGDELYSLPCEFIFNAHPDVHRTALVGVNGKAVLCVETEKRDIPVDLKKLESALLKIGAGNPLTKDIKTILFHPDFPVDIRHNAKIIREELAIWAKDKLR